MIMIMIKVDVVEVLTLHLENILVFVFGVEERENKSLALSNLQLRKAIWVSSGNRGRISEGTVVSKPVKGAALGVLPDVIIRELSGCA